MPPLIASTVLACCLIGPSAVADDGAPETSADPDGVASVSDSSRAQQLYDAGLAAMLDGNYSEGCAKLAESHRLDPLPGALFTLAECRRRNGQRAAAFTHFRAYVDLLPTLPRQEQIAQQERAALARKHVEALSGQVARVTLEVPHLAHDATITVDGDRWEASALGVERALDAGEHSIVVSREDGREVSRRVVLGGGERRRVVIELPDETSDAPADTAPTPQSSDEDGLSDVAVAGLVVGGVGAAALIVGAVSGGLALSAKSTVDDNCDELACNQDGLDAAERGRTLGTVSTVAVIVGAAGVATGVTLWLLADDQAEGDLAITMTPAHGGGAAALWGTW